MLHSADAALHGLVASHLQLVLQVAVRDAEAGMDSGPLCALQRLRRLQSARAPSGIPTRDNADRAADQHALQQDHCAHGKKWCVRRERHELLHDVFHTASRDQRERDARAAPHPGQQQRFGRNHPHDLPARRAERAQDAQFVRAFHHRSQQRVEHGEHTDGERHERNRQ